MLEHSIICLIVVSCLLFCCGTVGPWPSPELGKINSTDGGVFKGTLTTNEVSWIGSIATLGSVLGTILSGILLENIGRKRTMLLIPIPLITSYVMLAFSKKLFLFYIARFLGGIPMGCMFAALPLYTGEIARNEHRGIISGMFGFFVHCSHILTYAAGPYMTSTAFNIMLAMLPIIYIPFFVFLGVESPQYYIKHEKFKEAKSALKRIRNKANDKELEEEFHYLSVLVKNKVNGSLLDILKHKGTKKALVMVIGLFTFLNLSGLNAVLTYTQQVFELAGTSIPPEQCAIILGIVELMAGAITPFLIANVGRKTLILSSNIATAIGYTILGTYFYLNEKEVDLESFRYVPIVSVIFAIVSCSIGMSPIPMVYISEIFPDVVKSSAAAFCTCYCWVMAFGVANLFPILSESIGTAFVFFGFSVICVTAIPFTLFFVVETKGKNLKEILEIFNK